MPILILKVSHRSESSETRPPLDPRRQIEQGRSCGQAEQQQQQHSPRDTMAGAGGLRRLQRLVSHLSRGARWAGTCGPAPAYSSTAITSAKVEVNGVHLHYQQTGEGSHVILLLPGMLGSGQTDFGPQLKSLNKQLFTLVAWDPRGYGKSIPPARDYPLDFFERDAKDAVDLMQTLKFKKFSLLGWSDGGITALIAAAKYPDLIHKMVVWGANANVTEEDVKLYNGIRDISKWSERTRKPMEAMYGLEYLSKTCSAWVDGISQFIHRPDGNICQSSLPHIKCPTLILHGEKDPLVPRFHPEYIHKHIANSQLHFFPEGKHNLHLRFAEEFNELVEKFLL